MQRTFVRISLLAILSATGVATAPVDAATAVSPTITPVQKLPKIQLHWLASLSFAPSTALVGTKIAGTVTLLRPAVETLKVGLLLDGAEPNEIGVQVAPNAVAPMSVTVPAGADSATFEISTGVKAGVALPKSYTMTARYGDESKAASFTVTQRRQTKQLQP